MFPQFKTNEKLLNKLKEKLIKVGIIIIFQIHSLNYFFWKEKISSMQLCLSHLVDLSLGRPELVNGEHFNILHTLLHVVLKKLNLSDAPIEISDEHAEKAQRILNELPKEPSICFKEVSVFKLNNYF